MDEDGPAHRESGSVLRPGPDLDLPDGRRRAQLVADVVQPRHGAGLHSGILFELPLPGAGGTQARLHRLRSSSGETKIDRTRRSVPNLRKARAAGLQAWDPLNQKLRWNVEGGGGIGGGTTTTAGNLVFQTINDGRFRASAPIMARSCTR